MELKTLLYMFLICIHTGYTTGIDLRIITCKFMQLHM